MICDFPSPPVSQAWIFWSPSQVTSAGCVTNSTIATLLPGSHTASPWCILRTFRLDPLAIAWPGICYPRASLQRIHHVSCLQFISIILGVHCAIAFSWCALCLSPIAPVDLKPVQFCFPATAAVILLPISGWKSSSECLLCLLNLWSLSFSLGLFSVRQITGGSRWGRNKRHRLFLLNKAGTSAYPHAILQEQPL